MESAALVAEFDGRTGALVELVSKATGWRVQGRGELGRSWRLMAPLPKRRNHTIDAEEQAPPETAARDGGRTVRFAWRGLQSRAAGPLDIEVEQTVTLDEAAGLRFETTVRNGSPLVIESLSSPCLGDLAMPGPDEPLELMHPSYCGMARRPLAPHFSGDIGYFGFDHPWMTAGTYPESTFALAASKRQGLYVGCHDASCREPVRFAFWLKPGFEIALHVGDGLASPTGQIDGRPSRLEMEVWHFPWAARGETIELAPVVLSPYAGPWTRGVDLYKAWRATWHRPPPTPEWARDVHAWQQIHINSPEDELRCRYSDLVTYGEDCARHGVAALQLTGWTLEGQDRGNPSHDVEPRLGTTDELSEAIARIQAIGVRVILFSKFTWADRSQKWFRDELQRYACKDPYGDYYMHPGYRYQTPTQLADLNTRRLIPMCQSCPDWRDIARAEFRKLLALGAAGTLYDEAQHHGGAHYCHDPSHGHRVPAHVYAGALELAKEFRDLVREAGREADFLLSGEACYDLQYAHYSVSYFRIMWPEHLAVQRYIDPLAGIMVAVTGFDDRETLNKCLLYRYIASYEPLNFKGRLDDFPRTMEYGKRIDALRRRWRDFLWDGEFCDTEGMRVTAVGDGAAQPVTTVFRHATSDRRAAVIANMDADQPMEVEVEPETAGRQLVLATPEQIDGRAVRGSVQIPPRSVGVVMVS